MDQTKNMVRSGISKPLGAAAIGIVKGIAALNSGYKKTKEGLKR